MSKANNLTDFLEGVADSIRIKKGTSALIDPQDFEDEISSISGGGKESIEWNQCPTLVKNFLANVTYDPSDYTVSHIAEYAPATAVTANTKPIGRTVDGVTFYNEVPNALTPFATTNKAGTLKPLDRLRWINTVSTENVRDIGGWACDGGTVKYGLLFRGGAPYGVDKDLMINKLGIKHELDLRGNSEARGYSVWGIDYTAADGYAWYSLADKEAWGINLRCVFENAVKTIPVFFHCAAGADRTGTLACVVEAILGVSQSDIDKDYELTCFDIGTDTDLHARRRNEAEWTGLINAIKAVPLEGGLSDSFRNRAVSFCISLGFTLTEINAFRTAMIDGTPTAITATIPTQTITNTLAHVTSDNSAVSISKYQPYQAKLTPENGYAIDSVKVKMGGVDITNQVFSGTETNIHRSVENTLSHCTSNNDKIAVIDGQGYTAELTADDGYTLDEEAGASIEIKIGGTVVYPPEMPLLDMNRPDGANERTITNTAYCFNKYQRENDAVIISQACAISDQSANSITFASNGASGYACMFPVNVENGKTYKLSYDATGSPRVYITGHIDGASSKGAATNLNTTESVNSNTGNQEVTFTMASGTSAVLQIGFGASTSGSATFMNVKLEKVN